MALSRELRALNAQIELTTLNVRNVALNAKLKIWLERRTRMMTLNVVTEKI